MSFSRSGREDNVWKQTTVNDQRRLFPGPCVRGRFPALCKDGDCLFVEHQDFKRPFLNSQKTNTHFLRDVAIILSKLKENEPKPNTEISNTYKPTTGELCRLAMSNRPSKKLAHYSQIHCSKPSSWHPENNVCENRKITANQKWPTFPTRSLIWY